MQCYPTQSDTWAKNHATNKVAFCPLLPRSRKGELALLHHLPGDRERTFMPHACWSCKHCEMVSEAEHHPFPSHQEQNWKGLSYLLKPVILSWKTSPCNCDNHWPAVLAGVPRRSWWWCNIQEHHSHPGHATCEHITRGRTNLLTPERKDTHVHCMVKWAFMP